MGPLPAPVRSGLRLAFCFKCLLPNFFAAVVFFTLYGFKISVMLFWLNYSICDITYCMFFSMFNDCISYLSDLRTLTQCEMCSMHSAAVELGVLKLSEGKCYSGNVVDNFFSSLFLDSHTKGLSQFSMILIKSFTFK